MGDLEMTKLCAEAMGKTGIRVADIHGRDPIEEGVRRYVWSDDGMFYPLRNDEQAMALVKRFHLHIGKTLRTPVEPHGQWFVSRTDRFEVVSPDLNRAICLCVAKMQSAKVTA